MRRGYRDHPVPDLSWDNLAALRSLASGGRVTVPRRAGELEIDREARRGHAVCSLAAKKLIYVSGGDIRLTTLGHKALETYQNVEIPNT